MTREARGELEVMGRRKKGIDLVRDLTQLFKAPSAQLLFESGSASRLTFVSYFPSLLGLLLLVICPQREISA